MYIFKVYIRGFIAFVLWLWWVFITAHGPFSGICKWGLLSRCSARDTHRHSFSSSRAQALGMWASAVASHRLSCCAACGIFPDQESNQCPFH